MRTGRHASIAKGDQIRVQGTDLTGEVASEAIQARSGPRRFVIHDRPDADGFHIWDQSETDLEPL